MNFTLPALISASGEVCWVEQAFFHPRVNANVAVLFFEHKLVVGVDRHMFCHPAATLDLPIVVKINLLGHFGILLVRLPQPDEVEALFVDPELR